MTNPFKNPAPDHSGGNKEEPSPDDDESSTIFEKFQRKTNLKVCKSGHNVNSNFPPSPFENWQSTIPVSFARKAIKPPEITLHAISNKLGQLNKDKKLNPIRFFQKLFSAGFMKKYYADNEYLISFPLSFEPNGRITDRVTKTDSLMYKIYPGKNFLSVDLLI